MRILVLNPYHSGSHRSFIEGWIKHSQHDFTLLTLPGHHWKWRMRHSPLTFAQQVKERTDKGKKWDLLFSTDMLNLPEFLGFAPEEIRKLPGVIYFHENQITYPTQTHDKRDLHFAYTNFLTAVKADQLWFNSDFHRQDFLNALDQYLPKMPGFQNTEQVELIRKKAIVQYPGIEQMNEVEKLENKQIHFLWCARWEYDKNPEEFFSAMSVLKEAGYSFRLSVIGESYRNQPDCFDVAKKQFAEEIVHWGYQESRKEYEKVLEESDVIVSTATHEFFGISAVEAVLANCFPIVPQRLAYPEVFENFTDFLYDGTKEGLIKSLIQLLKQYEAGNLWTTGSLQAKESFNRFLWTHRSSEMDQACENLVRKS